MTGLAVLVPVLTALLLLPAGTGKVAWRVNLAGSLLACAVMPALWVFPATASAGFWLGGDALAVHMAGLASLVGAIAAGSLHVPPTIGARATRFLFPGFQVALAGVQAALLSDGTGLAWVGLLVAALVCRGFDGDTPVLTWQRLLPLAAGLLLTGFGLALLPLAALPAVARLTDPGWAAASWSGLRLAAAGTQGALLNLGFVPLLLGLAVVAGLAPLRGRDGAATPVAFRLLDGLVGLVALVLLLRLRGVMAANAGAAGGAIDPRIPLVALGLLTLWLGALGLWGRDPGSAAARMQTGLAVTAAGIGGAGGLLAAVLLLTGTVLGRTAGTLAESRPGGALPSVALGALAGLPPFAVFAGGVLALRAAAALQPVLALAMLAGLATGIWPLVRALGPRTESGTRGQALAGAWIALALSASIGLGLPAGWSTWMRTVAEAAG